MSSADARIRRFSAFTWLTGSAVAVVVAFVTMPFLGINPNTGGLVFENPDDYRSPWDVPDVGELEIVDGEIVGAARGGYIDVPAGPDLWSISALSGTEDGVMVYQQVDADVPVSEERPEYLRALRLGDSVEVLPGARAGRLWFGAVLDDWTARVERVPATPIDGGIHSGKGSALLSYDGDALSGRFTYSGDGFFRVDAVLPGMFVDLTRGIETVDERASWPPGDRVAFRIDADDGSWTVTLDEPASPSSSAPPAQE